MAEQVDLIVRNGTVVTSDTTAQADLAIKDGKFVAIAPRGGLSGYEAAEEYDATGKHVLPGVIDGHVHFREPGLEYKEDWRTGSTAAVFGGVTTVVEMPNTKPKTDTVENVELKRRLAEEKSYVDFGIIGLLVQDSVPQLRPMAEAGVVGYKCFLGETIGNIPAPDDGMMLDGLREIAATGLRIGFHAENNEIMQHLIRQMKEAGRTDPLAHVDSRPPLAEVESIQRMGLYAKHTGTKIHIFHLSSREGLDMIDEWRAKGVDITCETGAHYVFLKAEDMARLGVRLRMNPPVRYGSEGHGDYLLEGLKDGRVNAIATDHSPHTAEEKLNDDIWKAISGFPGVETSVRFFLTFGVNAGRMTLQQYVRASSEGPAKMWDMYPQKGAIALGSDGDLTIVDLEKEGIIREDELHSKNHVTPYDGTHTKGDVVATIVRGQIIMRDGKIVGAAAGRMVRPNLAGKNAAVEGVRELVERAPAAELRIVGATVIDGTGGAPIHDAVIEVRDGLIAAVGPRGAARPPEGGVAVHDARDRFIIPGLIDSHVHVALSPLTYARARDPMGVTDGLLRSFVQHGVTTVRDPGTPDLGPFFAELTAGRRGWPRFFGAGPLIDGPPGVHWAGTRVVDSVAGARAEVNALADGGARLIKTYFWMTPPLLRGVAEAAHERGLPVSYHPGLVSVDDAVRAGVDQIEHLMNAPELLPADEQAQAADLPEHDWDSLLFFRLWEHVDPGSRAARSSVDRLAHAGTFLTPTLALSDALLAGSLGRHAAAGRAAAMPTEVVARWESTAHPESYTADDLARAPAILRRQLDFVGMAHGAGVRIAAGTGGLGHFIVPGASLHDELELLVRAGMSPMEALIAGTRRGGELLGQPGLTGTLAPGSPADFVVLRADPLKDIANTRAIGAVVMRGDVVSGHLA